ncbi:MAG: hypothetical protein IKM39_01270 [Clostridia bacterium]|nr:hypothetical protein [Clostridia bacterium]
MKKSKRIALCGMMSALALVIMLLAYFPYFTYMLPALAGSLFAIVMIEVGHKWAWGGYITAAILSMLLCEKEAAVLFVTFFGYYPITKSYLEKVPTRIVEYILKFALFNAAVVAAYLVIINVLGIPIENIGQFGKYTMLILLGMGNVMFWLYDLALSRVYHDYMVKFHAKVKGILK